MGGHSPRHQLASTKGQQTEESATIVTGAEFPRSDASSLPLLISANPERHAVFIHVRRRRMHSTRLASSPAAFCSSNPQVENQRQPSCQKLPLKSIQERVFRWLKGFGSIMIAAGWGEVGSAVPDVRHWRALRSQMRIVLRQLPLWERAGIGALAGGLAGGFTNATLHPLDTVKTKLQARGSASLYSGPLDVVRKLSASQGLAGFYRGLPAAIFGSFVSSAIYFGTYELAKGVLSRPIHVPLAVALPILRRQPCKRHRFGSTPDGTHQCRPPNGADVELPAPPAPGTSLSGGPPASAHSWRGDQGKGEGANAAREQRGPVLALPAALVPPLAAALGNVASSAILVPKEVIKQRLQAAAGEASTMRVLRHTLQQEGLAGLYVGYSAAILRNLPTNVLNFSIFEYLRAVFLATSKQGPGAGGGVSGIQSLAPWQSIVSGAMAGIVSSATTTPLDVVKTRLMTQARASVLSAGLHAGPQAEAAAKAQALAAYTYSGVLAMLRTVWAEEGAAGLLRGMGPRVLYGASFSAIGFFSYEAARLFLLRSYLMRKSEKELTAERG